MFIIFSLFTLTMMSQQQKKKIDRVTLPTLIKRKSKIEKKIKSARKIISINNAKM